MTSSPAVSVIIPAYNPGPFLAETLDSVVTQTFEDLEVVVVDDGSDKALSWVRDRDPRVRYVRQPNRGLSAARNAGIAASTGPLVAFVDADDLWLPPKIERQVEQFARDRSLGLLSTAFSIIDEAGEVTGGGFEGHHRSLAELRQGNGICVSTVMVPRGLLDRVGLFDLTLDAAQDWDLWLRCAAVSTIMRIDEPLALYRVHSLGMSQDWRRTYREARQVLRRHSGQDSRVGRRRAAELAAFQAFDSARQSWNNRSLTTAARDLQFVARHRPAVLAGAARGLLRGGLPSRNDR